MRRLNLTLLGLALASAFGVSAQAQVTNPFVSAAQAPGVPVIPAPPAPPGAKKPAAVPYRGATGTPEGAAGLVFGALPRQPAALSKPTDNIRSARPGQTLTAPSLPKMPPLPSVTTATVSNIGGQPYFGGNKQTIDQVALMEQTSPVKAMKFTADTGKTYRIVMSSVSPNLIMSPFQHPQLIMTSANAVHFVSHGSSLVVTVAPGQPVGAYITGMDPSDPLVALVFEPKPLPPQNYELAVDGFIQKKGGDTASANAPEAGQPAVEGTSNQHTQRVVSLIEATLSGSIPDGFGPVSRRHWPLGRNQSGLVVEPVEVLSSGGEVIDVLSVTNTTTAAVSLEENDFYRRGVEGVALSDHKPLQPGQSLRVAILRRASESDASDTLMSVSRP